MLIKNIVFTQWKGNQAGDNKKVYFWVFGICSEFACMTVLIHT